MGTTDGGALSKILPLVSIHGAHTTLMYTTRNSNRLSFSFLACLVICFEHSGHIFFIYFLFYFQINGLGRYETGLMWSVHTNRNIVISTIIDWTWFTISFAFPMVQSLYLTCKKFKTQILIVTIRDNRKAQI